ncbi:MAG TPA: UDP-glucose 4-epimerase GalE, partial [Candidatus Dormibacteraeota bacterium]|nr:UDP-glucose 4-epimerase GalE [Candidatus Dormibacteraeota bacterium]
GDPPALVASAERIRDELNWRPRLDDLDAIVRTSLEWERRMQRDPW